MTTDETPASTDAASRSQLAWVDDIERVTLANTQLPGGRAHR